MQSFLIPAQADLISNHCNLIPNQEKIKEIKIKSGIDSGASAIKSPIIPEYALLLAVQRCVIPNRGAVILSTTKSGQNQVKIRPKSGPKSEFTRVHINTGSTETTQLSTETTPHVSDQSGQAWQRKSMTFTGLSTRLQLVLLHRVATTPPGRRGGSFEKGSRIWGRRPRGPLMGAAQRENFEHLRRLGAFF